MTRAPKAEAEKPVEPTIETVHDEAVAEANTPKDDSRPDPDKVHSGDQRARAKKIAFSGYNPGE